MILLLKANFIMFIVGGVAIFSVLVIFIILFISLYQKRYYKHLKEKQIMQSSFQEEVLRTQLETQENTFQQIAKELHDNVGQLLSTTKMLLGITERNLNTVPDTLLTAHATLGKAINELRSFSKSLDTEWLQQFNLLENLKTEVSRINAGQIIKATCDYTAKIELEPDWQIILFRIIQEAIQNAIKHGDPSNIDIIIKSDEKKVQAIVSDNGNGFDQKIIFPGMGQRNMTRRHNY